MVVDNNRKAKKTPAKQIQPNRKMSGSSKWKEGSWKLRKKHVEYTGPILMERFLFLVTGESNIALLLQA